MTIQPIEVKTHSNTFWTRLVRLPRAWISATLILLLAFAALFAPLIAPHDGSTQYRDGLSEFGTPLPPTERFPLGTDHLGRDVLSRALYGARVSLFIALTANIAAALFGTAVGVIAGYYGGAVESVLMRLTDIMLAFPAILLALGLSAVLRPSVNVVIMIVAVITWPLLARLVRSQTLVIGSQDYVESARAIGGGNLYIIFVHIIPHVITVTVVWATLNLATTVLIEAALSYLGVGVPATTPSWGNMVADGQSRYRTAPWMVFVPSFAIMLTTLAFNLMGDAIRDALDPRSSTR